MDQNQLRSFIVSAVVQLETSNLNPYMASFAGGNSGLSFGRMQNDVANNSAAKAAFAEILYDTQARTGLSAAQIQSIVARAATKGVAADSFSDVERRDINTALQADSAVVDATDLVQENKVIGYVNDVLAAAAANSNGPGALNSVAPDLGFITELAEWGNRTGGLTATATYIRTASVVTRQNYDQNYLSQQKQFTTGGESFSHWTGRINTATSIALQDNNIFALTLGSSQNLTASQATGAANYLAFWKNDSGQLSGQFLAIPTQAAGLSSGALEIYDQNQIIGILNKGTWVSVTPGTGTQVDITLPGSDGSASNVPITIDHLGNGAVVENSKGNVIFTVDGGELNFGPSSDQGVAVPAWNFVLPNDATTTVAAAQGAQSLVYVSDDNKGLSVSNNDIALGAGASDSLVQ